MTREREALTTVYEEVCRAHDGIADFRAKLLAFLPFASGTGIFLLLGGGEVSENEHLVAIGLFGAFVTLGLFIYELRGIQRCNSLSNCGRNLENELLGHENHTGTFVGEPDTAFFFVGNTWASIFTYSTVTCAWIYVAQIGWNIPHVVPLTAASWVVLVIVGNSVRVRQDAILKDRIAQARKEKNVGSTS